MNTHALDNDIAVLAAHKQQWVELPIARKLALLQRTQQRLRDALEVWVEVGAQVRHTDPHSPWGVEEWLTGPYIVGTSIVGYSETLTAITAGRLPAIRRLYTRPSGQLVAEVFPANASDSLLFNGISVEVWMQDGVTAQNLHQHIGGFYQQPQPQGRVALVLGAAISAPSPRSTFGTGCMFLAR
ncbi:hypothetical protein HC891_11055 [Candidatus Gracilibacteria bacterium]|nr:hypothetical protein [Candidatus Gracilibacteria bacterium]